MHSIIKTALAALTLSVAVAPAIAADAAKPAFTTTDTDIGTLIDTPSTRAIIDKMLPDFATNPQISMARPMTFRAIQQFVPDQLTTAKLDALDVEFAKVPAPAK